MGRAIYQNWVFVFLMGILTNHGYKIILNSSNFIESQPCTSIKIFKYMARRSKSVIIEILNSFTSDKVNWNTTQIRKQIT